MLILETERLYLRDWSLDDFDAFRALATDPRVMRYIGPGQPWPDDRILRFITSGIEQSKTRGWILWPLILKQTHQLIGICGFNDGFPPDTEIGWWLSPQYWNQGLATEAARATMQYGFTQWNFPRLISVAQPENLPSIRIMQKLGMTPDRSFTHDGIAVVSYAIDNPSAPHL